MTLEVFTCFTATFVAHAYGDQKRDITFDGLLLNIFELFKCSFIDNISEGSWRSSDKHHNQITF